MTVTLAWEIYGQSAGGYPGGLATVYPAFAASVLSLIVVSLATPAPTQKELAALR